MKRARATFLGAIATIGLTGPTWAQVKIVVPPIEVHTLVSKQVGDSFRIQVLLPPMLPGETTRFPVLYMTDVDGQFMASDVLRLMMYAGDVPRFIAVGIGYPGVTSIMQTLEIRSRDLTQVPRDMTNDPGQLPVEGGLVPTKATGGAPQFLEFIRRELIPFIDARYRTDPSDRGYWGDSLGGLFGCYVLFTQPETFGRSVIGSPSLWWANEEMLGRAKRFTETHSELAARVFLGVGGLEEVGELAGSFRMVTNTLRLERLLHDRRYPGLELSAHVFPDESHTTVATMNLIRGLVAVYGRPAPAESFMAKAAALQAKPRD